MINLEKFKHQSWLDGRIIAINGDCQEVMAEIVDKTFNLIISDGPYFKISMCLSSTKSCDIYPFLKTSFLNQSPAKK